VIDLTNLFKGFYTLPGAEEAFAENEHPDGCGCEHHGNGEGRNAEESNDPSVTILDIMLPAPPPGMMEEVADVAFNRQFFHQGVKFLADGERWFVPPINELCRTLDGLIEDGTILLKHDIPKGRVGVGVGVSSIEDVKKTLTFMLGVRNNKPDMAGILIPKGWWKRMLANPFYRLGGVVMMASQACDFYHSVQPEMERAHAWEAQYLLAVLQRRGFYKLNRYQRWLLECYPEGLSSIHRDRLYPRRVFIPGTNRAAGRAQGEMMWPLWK
jgi:hypothetical protein